MLKFAQVFIPARVVDLKNVFWLVHLEVLDLSPCEETSVQVGLVLFLSLSLRQAKHHQAPDTLCGSSGCVCGGASMSAAFSGAF